MINSYYASYSLEYYEIGEVYSFYTRKGEHYAPVADEEVVEKYADKLEKLEKDTDEYPKMGNFDMLVRTCGVCVEKLEGDGKGRKDRIRFLIKLVDADGTIHYGTKLYVVNYTGIEMDGWEALPVQTELVDGQFYVIPPHGTSIPQSSKGRVTVDDSKPSGRVTIDEAEKNGQAAKGRKKAASGVTIDEKTGVTLDED